VDGIPAKLTVEDVDGPGRISSQSGRVSPGQTSVYRRSATMHEHHIQERNCQEFEDRELSRPVKASRNSKATALYVNVLRSCGICLPVKNAHTFGSTSD